VNAVERKRLIALIHVGKRDLQMDDDSYRLMLAGIAALGGATSTAALSIPQLNVVVASMKEKGFRPRSNKTGTKKPADDAQSKKLRSLWLELYELGEVKDPSEDSLTRFVARIAKVDALQWVTTKQASLAIEQLKQWLARAKSRGVSA
jgi:phage gp16-like protein